MNEDSLCDIYINLGADHLCDTCKVYPRQNWVYGDLTFVGKAILALRLHVSYLNQLLHCLLALVRMYLF